MLVFVAYCRTTYDYFKGLKVAGTRSTLSLRRKEYFLPTAGTRRNAPLSAAAAGPLQKV
jgi:hypothetical protein